MKLSPVHVVIKSYQSIDELEFDVTGFTCITGKTNIGKSAIMRAVSGALLNKPVTNQVRSGAKSCSVRLASEQWGLLWEKAEKGLNRYTIDGKAEKLENVGQRQPEPIAAMGFSSVRIGDKDLYPWYASQWTPVFLLDEGGPTVTQFISEISGLDILQNAISLGLKSRKKVLDDGKAASCEADQFKAKLTKVEKLDDLIVLTSELGSQAESIEEYEARIKRGKELEAAIANASAMIGVLSRVADVRVPPNGMGEEISTTLSMHHRLVKLDEAAKSIIALRGGPSSIPVAPESEHETWVKIRKYESIDRLKSSVGKLEPIGDVSLPAPPAEADVGRIKRAKALHEQIKKLQKSTAVLDSKLKVPSDPDVSDRLEKVVKGKSILSEMDRMKSDIDQLNLGLSQLNADLNGVLEELKSIPSCPTCKRPLASKHVHEAGGATS